jgi:hypothetical protein
MNKLKILASSHTLLLLSTAATTTTAHIHTCIHLIQHRASLTRADGSAATSARRHAAPADVIDRQSPAAPLLLLPAPPLTALAAAAAVTGAAQPGIVSGTVSGTVAGTGAGGDWCVPPRPAYDLVEEYCRALDEYKERTHAKDGRVAAVISRVADFLLEFATLGHEEAADVPPFVHPRVPNEDLASLGVPFLGVDEEGRSVLHRCARTAITHHFVLMLLVYWYHVLLLVLLVYC